MLKISKIYGEKFSYRELCLRLRKLNIGALSSCLG